jgi:hypothetical protein
MTFLNMSGFKTTVLKSMAGALILSAGMAMPVFAQAQAAPEMKVAMAMPMHAGSKMVRHGKRHMSHHMAAKDNDRYGMK